MREVRRSVGEQVVVAEQTAEEEPEEHQMRAARVVHRRRVVRESFRVRMIRGRVVHSEVRQDFGVRELLQWKEAGLHVNRSFGSVRTDA